jgi:negative regulator of sigma E activity
VSEYTRDQLRGQARVLGVTMSGTKAEIEARVAAAVEDEAAGARGYTIGTWHGRPNYECGRCVFKTLKRRAIAIHISDEHGGLT